MLKDTFGQLVFNDSVMAARLPRETYEEYLDCINFDAELSPEAADVIANAMKDWAIEKGATHFTHWFQPMTGVTAEKHEGFIAPVEGGGVLTEFSGKELIKGEPDASSFPSGGLRATFEARGYTNWDPSSYAFIKDGVLCIPTAFCSYTGEALDKKTPLLRSMEAINKEGLRLLNALGITDVKRIYTTVGAEQEYFLIKEEDFKARRDLFYCGRTLFGAPAIKGQEMEDHYFGALRPKVKEFMKELDFELWKLGIAAKTKHNETAPAQHELAPLFCTTNIAVDQNLLIMEEMKTIAQRHGMECLLSEKPFMGINGSGKHNNWSLGTDTGINLLKPGKKPCENKLFLLVLAAVIKAVDEYQDLLRISAATPGNDCRLGGDEAPPAIISIFLGDELDTIVNSIVDGSVYNKKQSKYMSLGVATVPSIRVDDTDRNRTSPFAFTGNKFEFRMVGSSQNIALANIVLNTAVANSFSQFADVLEGAENVSTAIDKLLADTFREHRRILFAGNSYSAEWEAEAKARGLSNFKTSTEAYSHFTDEKNVELFTKYGVMSKTEMISRREIFFENYRKVKNIEAKTMLEMTVRDFIPAVSSYITELAEGINLKKSALKTADTSCEEGIMEKLSGLLGKTYEAYRALEAAEAKAVAIKDVEEAALYYTGTVEGKMLALRKYVDQMELLTKRSAWPVPTYGDLTFGV